MLNTHISRYWLVAAVCLLMYIEVGRTDDTINLDDVPTGNYTLEIKQITPTSLSGWYKMTNGFLSLVHSKSSEAIDVLIEYLKGKKIELHHMAHELIKVQSAMYACIVIGLLFTVAIFITGLVFFCCRMCGKCGGKRVQVITSSTSLWRKILILCLIVLLAFILPAAITLFIINGSLNKSFVETEKTLYASLHDSEIFVNDTYSQASFLTYTGVNKAVNGITKRINNVQTFIEGEMKSMDMTQKLEEAKIPLFGWLNISMAVQQAIGLTKSIKNTFEASNIVANLTYLQRELENWKSNCTDENWKSHCTGQNWKSVDPTVFKLNKNESIVVNVGSNLNKIQDGLKNLKKEDYEKILHNIISSMKSIPYEITEETAPIRRDVIRDLEAYRVEVLTSDVLKKLENFTDLARSSIQKAEHEAQKIFPEARKYDKLRWYIGLGVGIVIAAVVGGLFIGLFFGICGYSHNRQATKRTALSNGAGLILMFTVYWMFLFSGLLMLLTTAMFAVGGVVEAYLCRPLFEENYKTLDRVMDAARQTAALNASSIVQNIVPSVALSTCEKNGTAYGAFNLEHLNISSILQYEERLKLDQRLHQLQNIRFPQPKLITKQGKDAFEALSKAMDINIIVDIEKLGEKFIDGYEEQFEIILNSTDPFVETVTHLIPGINETLNLLEMQRVGLTKILQMVQTGSLQLKNGAMAVQEEFSKTEEMLKTLIPKMGKQSITRFVEQLKAYGDGIIQNVMEIFETKLAPCKPLWNIFDSSRTVVCKYYVLPLNGIWFAIGWSLFFFIPTIVIGTKLSKHFFKMSYVATGEKDEKNEYDLELTNGYKTKPDNGWYSPSHHL